MAIYAECEKCGNETINYLCAVCLQVRVDQFEKENKLTIDEEMERCISIVHSKGPWIGTKWMQVIVNEIRQR